MNLENIEPIVSPNDPDFLRHSNSALRKKLSEVKKDLAKAQKKIKDLQCGQLFNSVCWKEGSRNVALFFCIYKN